MQFYEHIFILASIWMRKAVAQKKTWKKRSEGRSNDSLLEFQKSLIKGATKITKMSAIL